MSPGSHLAPTIITIDKINSVCCEEITKQLDVYLNDHIDSELDGIYPYLSEQDTDDFFLLFMDYTFGQVHPNIHIDVYLPYPLTLTDTVRQEVARVIVQWITVSEEIFMQPNKLLTYYAEAWAICNKSFLTRYIKQNMAA
jgi:hypothetical protein